MIQPYIAIVGECLIADALGASLTGRLSRPGRFRGLHVMQALRPYSVRRIFLPALSLAAALGFVAFLMMDGFR